VERFGEVLLKHQGSDLSDQRRIAAEGSFDFDGELPGRVVGKQFAFPHIVVGSPRLHRRVGLYGPDAVLKPPEGIFDIRGEKTAGKVRTL